MKANNYTMLLERLLPEKFGVDGSVSKDTQQTWVNIMIEQSNLIEDRDFDRIYECLNSLDVDEIDTDITSASAAIIANYVDANMNIDEQCAVCFIAYSKKKKSKN